MTEETEASYAAAFFEWHATRTDGDGSRNSVALEIFEQNKRLNKPQETREPTLTAWEKDRVVGSGLTERVFWKVRSEGFVLQEGIRARKKMRKRMARQPLRVEEERMAHEMREWLGGAGCGEIAQAKWLWPEAQMN